MKKKTLLWTCRASTKLLSAIILRTVVQKHPIILHSYLPSRSQLFDNSFISLIRFVSHTGISLFVVVFRHLKISTRHVCSIILSYILFFLLLSVLIFSIYEIINKIYIPTRCFNFVRMKLKEALFSNVTFLKCQLQLSQANSRTWPLEGIKIGALLLENSLLTAMSFRQPRVG